jgi:hypothetical protein
MSTTKEPKKPKVTKWKPILDDETYHWVSDGVDYLGPLTWKHEAETICEVLNRRYRPK